MPQRGAILCKGTSCFPSDTLPGPRMTDVQKERCNSDAVLWPQDAWDQVKVENAERSQLGTGKPYDRKIP